DVVAYYRENQPDWSYYPTVSDDGHYLVITTNLGTDPRYQIAVKDLTDPYAMPVQLIDNFEHEYEFFGNDGPVLYFLTDVDAPRKRVIAIDLRKPERANWREVIPQADSTLQGVSYV